MDIQIQPSIERVRKVIKPVPFKPYNSHPHLHNLTPHHYHHHSQQQQHQQQQQQKASQPQQMPHQTVQTASQHEQQPPLQQHQQQSVHIAYGPDISHHHHFQPIKNLSDIAISSQRSSNSRGTDGSIYSSPFSSLDDSENENIKTTSLTDSKSADMKGINSNNNSIISNNSDDGKMIMGISHSSLKRIDSINKSNLSQSQGSLSRSCSAVVTDDIGIGSTTTTPTWYTCNDSTLLKLPPPISWDLAAITAASRRRPLIYSSEYLSQTPSPNDSIVVELEAILREKDSEISYLRETLERNEQVIFKVYEEKGQKWEGEFKKLKSQYEARLKNYQNRLTRAEQTITLQNKQNLADQENLLKELDSARKRGDALETANNCLRSELNDFKEMVETLKWTLHERNGEVALLKSQARDSTIEINQRATEIVSLRKKVKESNENLEEAKVKNENLQKELQSSQDEANSQIQTLGQKLTEVVVKLDERSKVIDQMSNDKQDLQKQVASLREKLVEQEKNFEEERRTWKDEKEKVLKYQQQLQAKYKKMLNANKFLEDFALLLRKEGLSKVDEFQC
ncbi:uncharacterized protein LOC141854932 [Brevipalpus obovatus]|uniref:uncharacterized protein LOC141854932 n=1 Tax=Brevipalpus obovatus TaxID=246614 RepID=UPI003D9F89DA